MTRLTAMHTARLTANLANRTISGLLLPFGEEGATNLGRLTASAHTLTLPDAPGDLTLNIEHQATHPIGTAVQLTEEPAGIRAAFHIAQTAAGDDALAEVEAGLRVCLSAEVDDTVVRSGRLVGGRLTGAGLVARPAFPSAKLAAAEDTGDLVDDYHSETTETYVDPGTGEAITESTVVDSTVTTDTPDPDQDDEEDDTDTTDVLDEDDPERNTIMARQTARAPRSTLAATKARTSKGTTARDLYRLIAGAAGGDRQMLAALSDVVPANILGIEQPQYVGELWQGKAYQRQFIPAWNHADLASYDVTGWRWVDRPTVAPYQGNKTAVPSNAIKTEQVKLSAERIAGAHDIDRKFRDFNDTEFWDAYFRAMTEAYAKVSDTTALAEVIDAAPDVPMGSVPTGVSKGLTQVVDGILAIIAEVDTIPDTAFMAPDLYRDFLLTTHDNALAYLDAALGFEDGTMSGFKIKPTAQIAAGRTLVSCHDAVTVHELGGESPIRVEAIDLAKGGIDQGVFGYLAVNVQDAGGLALVAVTTQP